MPKKRNAAQRIGDIGEDFFRISCQENFLIPNKVEHDFGFDFLCHMDMAASFKQTGQISGTVIGFSVRSTDREDARIRLNRADAECMLAAHFPVGLALVKLNGPTSSDVYFRLMDADFIVELSSFLATRKKSKHFTPKDMRPITELRDAVRGVGAPGYLERVRADAAQRIAEPITGPVQIQIHRDADSQATLVTTLDLYAWFEQGTPAEKEALYLATFGMPARRDQRLRELALKSGVMGGLAHLPQPYVLAGFVMDHPTSVRVRGTAGSMELPALRTANEHHYGYVHTAGFALTMSTRVKHNGQYVHWMRAFTDPRSDALLRDHPDLLDFLYACRPDSTFAFDDPNGLLLTANLFEGLGESVNFAANYRSAQGMDGWDRVPVTVRDIGDLTSQHSLMFLAAAADPQINPIPRGLLLAGPEVEEEDCETETAIIHVPVVCNLTSVSIVAWFSGLGSALCRDGEPCGFKVDSYHSRRVEIHPLMESQSSFPQIPLGPRTLSWSDGRWGEADGPPSGWGDIRLRFEWD